MPPYVRDEKKYRSQNMQQEVTFLLGIVRYLLNNRIVELPQPCKDLDWNQMIKLAERHNIVNLLCYVIEDLPDEIRPNEAECEYLYKCMNREMIRSYRQTDAADAIAHAFEKVGIRMLAVKGVCTKKHYPEPDMRTMGDVDILYQTSQEAKVKSIMEDLGYECKQEGRKHDLYKKKPYVGVELHRELVASDSEYGSYYENIWDKISKKEGFQYIYEMSREDEYIYTLVHLVEHFINGGVGIRFIMDIYVYNNIANMDWEYIERELKKLGIGEFYQNLSKLAECWFGQEGDHVEDAVLMEMADYILAGGVFGSGKNAAAISVAREGKFKFLWKTIFPNLKNMQSMFPWLKKWPILLPYSWVLRGVRSVCHRRGNIKEQFGKYKYGDQKRGEELQQFFEMCGL